ncbi:MAG: hypothetical protein NTX28_10025 [Novosphingobium sp.]|nr:hypothetical protein [Novosphingobium sp.]
MSDLDRNIAQVGRQLQWWRAAIEREDMEALKHSCELLGREGIRQFALRNDELLLELIGLPPKAREQAVQDAPSQLLRHSLLLCAIQRVQCAVHWLFHAKEMADLHYLKMPDHRLTQQAANDYLRFVELHPPFWPYEDGTDPLGEGLQNEDD